jgi:hypothetical protein
MRVSRTAAVLGAVLLLAVGCSFGGPGGKAPGTLAKIDGWREGMTVEDVPFAVLEIAFDVATAQALWDENVPDDLPRLEGDPASAGVYGDLADVDLTTHVVGLYSSGQSGSCPGWVRDVRTDGDGSVNVTTAVDMQGGDGCSDDYNPFRVVLALDRDDVPAQDALDARGTVDGRGVLEVLVTEYRPTT